MTGHIFMYDLYQIIHTNFNRSLCYLISQKHMWDVKRGQEQRVGPSYWWELWDPQSMAHTRPHILVEEVAW